MYTGSLGKADKYQKALLNFMVWRKSRERNFFFSPRQEILFLRMAPPTPFVNQLNHLVRISKCFFFFKEREREMKGEAEGGCPWSGWFNCVLYPNLTHRKTQTTSSSVSFPGRNVCEAGDVCRCAVCALNDACTVIGIDYDVYELFWMRVGRNNWRLKKLFDLSSL